MKSICQEDNILKEIVEETEKFFKSIGFEINFEKSETNSEVCSYKAIVLDADK